MTKYSLSQHIYSFLSIGIISLGLLVMIGWIFNIPILIQMFPTFVPMQFNTALCFAIIGFSFIFKRFNIAGFLLVAFGGITLLEYIFNISLGLDEMFMDHYILTETSHPGRMAPNTALAFLLCGLYFFKSNHKKFTTFLIGFIASLGIVSVSGYLLGIPGIYGWGNLTRMAIHTAIGFIFTSVCAISNFSTSSPNDYIPIGISSFFAVSFILIVESALSSNSNSIYLLLFFGIAQSVLTYFLLINRSDLASQLEHESNRLRTVHDLTTDGIWEWDIKKNTGFLSPRWKEVFGYADEEIENYFHWQKMIFPEDLKRAEIALENHLKKNEPYNLLVRYWHKNKSIVWILCRGIALRDDNGNPYKMIGSHTNVSDLKNTEEKLKIYSMKLNESNQDLEQFAYIASHDLQEPLRMVSGFLSLLKEEYYDSIDKEGKEYIDISVDAAKRMSSMIIGLLEFSRINRGKSNFEKIYINDAISTAIKNLTYAINEKEASVFYSPQSTKYKVIGDHRQLVSLIQNIISNAIKYCDRIPEIDISIEENDIYTKISVQDNGIGIDEKHFDRIFNIFQKLHSSEEYEGTGIGLAICRKIVQRHKGKISIESKPGAGSIFHIELPRHYNSGGTGENNKNYASGR